MLAERTGITWELASTILNRCSNCENRSLIQVFPKYRMVVVSSEVELDGPLQLSHSEGIVFDDSITQILLSLIQVIDVGLTLDKIHST